MLYCGNYVSCYLVLSVYSHIFVAHTDNVGWRMQDVQCLFVYLFIRSITPKQKLPRCSNLIWGMVSQ